MLTVRPHTLRCEYLRDPLGIDITTPRLSWQLAAARPSARQTAYQVQAAGTPEALVRGEAELWDSGRVDADTMAQVPYAGVPLRARQRVCWRVRVWDETGAAADFSAPACWEMGLLAPADWQAQWIGGDGLLRRAFTLARPIARARAYVCGVGYYELYLNGQRVGDHRLDPAQTDYERRLCYVTYDVTGLLQPGANAAGLLLGEGMYAQSRLLGNWGWPEAPYGAPRALLQVEVTHDDGSVTLLTTDPQWLTAPGPVVANNVYAGEEYDARREIAGWAEAACEPIGWRPAWPMDAPGGVLTAQMLEPIRAVETVTPVARREIVRGHYVYDLGQNIAGWARLAVAAPRGTRAQLRFAEEVFPSGRLNPASTGVFTSDLVATDGYTCAGTGVETWEPRFTYHGFRYVELTGLPEAPAEAVTGVVAHSEVAPVGSFACSDPLITRIYQNAHWTVRDNLHGLPTDCPHREKCGWLGDAQVMGEFAIYNFHLPALFSKYVADIFTGAGEGIPHNVAPGQRTAGQAVAAWGSACVQLPWYLYQYYGDTRVMARHYDGMTRWVEHLGRQAADGIISDADGILGDWCSPGSGRNGIHTPPSLVATGHYYLDLTLLAAMARLLGREADAGRLQAEATRVHAAFNARFYDPARGSYGSQTGEAFALALGLPPAGEAARVAASLARDVRARECHHTTGIAGMRHLYAMLARYGYLEEVAGLLRQTSYPSFGDLINQGATTLWETWEVETPADEPDPRSRNHPMFAGGLVWLFQGLAGITPTTPGFRQVHIRPELLPGLDWAQASYDSISGRITSAWRREGDGLELEVTIPPGATASVAVPARACQAEGPVTATGAEDGRLVYAMGSGTARFRCSE